MEARAISRFVRQSPRKMRLVIDLIRGKSVGEAYALLQYSKKRAAESIDKTLRRKDLSDRGARFLTSLAASPR